jgi:hypothetical protein
MELTALAALLTDRFGWNLARYDRMPAPVRTPSAGETATVTYQMLMEKRRRASPPRPGSCRESEGCPCAVGRSQGSHDGPLGMTDFDLL